MGPRHFYWILTDSSFAVHTSSHKKYRKKYKQRSSNYKKEHFFGWKIFVLLTTHLWQDRKMYISLNYLYFFLHFTNHMPTHTEQIFTKTSFLCLAHQENIFIFINYWYYWNIYHFIFYHGSNCSVFRTAIKEAKNKDKRRKSILMHY
jgi:hypothetical protein